MRTLNMIMGGLFAIAGVFMMANGGISFVSIAFILGLLLMLAGAFECLAFKSSGAVDEENTWILVDGFSTFVLGFLIITNKLAAEETVIVLLGFWILVAGVRSLTRAFEKRNVKNNFFYAHLLVGLVDFLIGFYMFFNDDVFNFTTGVLLGLTLIGQGLGIILIALSIELKKPQFLMTKEELLAQAKADAEKAHDEAKIAVKAAKEATKQVREIIETPEEEIDGLLSPAPEKLKEQIAQERAAQEQAEE